MEEITIKRWKTSDGQEFEDEEVAKAVEQQIWLKTAKEIANNGGLLVRVYDSFIRSLLDYIIASSELYRCSIKYTAFKPAIGFGYETTYVWQAKTIEQANRIAAAIMAHSLIPKPVMDGMIKDGVFTKHLGCTMALQMVVADDIPSILPSVSGRNYRIVSGLDEAFMKLHDTVPELQRLMYPTNNTQGDSE